MKFIAQGFQNLRAQAGQTDKHTDRRDWNCYHTAFADGNWAVYVCGCLLDMNVFVYFMTAGMHTEACVHLWEMSAARVWQTNQQAASYWRSAVRSLSLNLAALISIGQ